MLILATFALAASVCATASAAEDWVVFATAPQPDHQIESIDRSSIIRSGTIVRYWFKTKILDDSQAIPFVRTWDYALILKEADCSNQQSRNIKFIIHYRNGRVEDYTSKALPNTWVKVNTDIEGVDLDYPYICRVG